MVANKEISKHTGVDRIETKAQTQSYCALCFSVLLYTRYYRSQVDVPTMEMIPIEHS